MDGVWWIIGSLAAMVLVLCLGGYLGAGVAAPWTQLQEATWQALHAINRAAAKVERPYAAELVGTLGGRAVTVALHETRIVVDRTSVIERRTGVQVALVVDTAFTGTVWIRTTAPVDDEDDRWNVSERPCAVLGEPFRCDREPPDALRDALAKSRALVDRLALYDAARERGWRRVEITLADGKLAISGIAFGGTVPDAFALAGALAGTTPRPAPPLPEPPRQPVRERLATMADEASFGYAMVLLMLVIPLGLAIDGIVYRSTAIDGRVVEIQELVSEDSIDYYLVYDEGDDTLHKIPIASDTETVVTARCPKGFRIEKRPWETWFTCRSPVAELDVAAPAPTPIEQSRSWTAIIVLGAIALVVYSVTLGVFYRVNRRARRPAELPPKVA